MGSIVCQTCEEVIGYYECEKVVTLYGKCCENCSVNRGKSANRK
ncbi:MULTISPECIES: GapA-binding peptide SR1P [Bacillaceae]|uniref:GapA-binding peptide SR1P n=1 Tax=Evansella alkalicola TaxID=745819 RepID=A0ABS6JPP8_9BACI|nr:MULTISPECIES: GapA-binding peptide SR1P [Bacillaceae]MBU9720500.1 GapA-binding peptide SR1P [Bacillus alkalicola]